MWQIFGIIDLKGAFLDRELAAEKSSLQILNSFHVSSDSGDKLVCKIDGRIHFPSDHTTCL